MCPQRVISWSGLESRVLILCQSFITNPIASWGWVVKTIHQTKGKISRRKNQRPTKRILSSELLLRSKQGFCCQVAHLCLLVACSPHP